MLKNSLLIIFFVIIASLMYIEHVNAQQKTFSAQLFDKKVQRPLPSIFPASYTKSNNRDQQIAVSINKEGTVLFDNLDPETKSIDLHVAGYKKTTFVLATAKSGQKILLKHANNLTINLKDKNTGINIPTTEVYGIITYSIDGQKKNEKHLIRLFDPATSTNQLIGVPHDLKKGTLFIKFDGYDPVKKEFNFDSAGNCDLGSIYLSKAEKRHYLYGKLLHTKSMKPVSYYHNNEQILNPHNIPVNQTPYLKRISVSFEYQFNTAENESGRSGWSNKFFTVARNGEFRIPVKDYENNLDYAFIGISLKGYKWQRVVVSHSDRDINLGNIKLIPDVVDNRKYSAEIKGRLIHKKTGKPLNKMEIVLAYEKLEKGRRTKVTKPL